jgi:carbonic anhydrase
MSPLARRILIAATFVAGTIAGPVRAADEHAAHGASHEPTTPPAAHDPAPTPTHVESESTTPSALEVLDRLKVGNARYVAGEMTFPNLGDERRCETSTKGQKPLVTILSCADSRVPPEFIFDAGIGELFVIRVAGNVADTDEIGTAEYGAGHLHTPLIVVMGHSKCGAVTAVVNNVEVHGSLPKLVDNIIPAANEARKQGYTGDRLIRAAITANVRQSQKDLLTKSPEIRELVESGKVMLVGAVYDLHSGTIQWIGEHPQQTALLEGKLDATTELTQDEPKADSHGDSHDASPLDPHANAVASADDEHGAVPTPAPAKAQATPKPAEERKKATPASHDEPKKDDHDEHGAEKKDAEHKDEEHKDSEHASAAEDPAEKPTSAKDHVPAAQQQGWLLPIALAAGSAALSGGGVMLISMKKAKASAGEKPHAADPAHAAPTPPAAGSH